MHHRRFFSEMPNLDMASSGRQLGKREDFELQEIACERIDHAREFATYAWFN